MLLEKAYHAGIPAYIQAEPFTLKEWRPPGFASAYSQSTPETPSDETIQTSASKPNIDVSSAIGASQNGGSGNKKRKKHRALRFNSGELHELGDKVTTHPPVFRTQAVSCSDADADLSI